MIQQLGYEEQRTDAGAYASVLDVEKDDTQSILRFVSSTLSSQSSRRSFYENQWLYDIAQVAGFQWSHIRRDNYQMEEPPSLVGQKKLVVNRLMPTIQGLSGRMGKTPPGWSAMPQSTDSEDVKAARAADSLLAQFWRDLEMDEFEERLLIDMLTMGNIYWHAFWDTNRGRYIPNPNTPDTAHLPPFVREGDVNLRVVSPFELFRPLDVDHVDDWDWAIYARIYPLDWIKKKWPKHAALINSDDRSEGPEAYLRRVQNLIASYRFPSAFGSSVAQDSAVVKELHLRPTTSCPKGLKATIVNEFVVEVEELPEKYLGTRLEMPFGYLWDIHVHGAAFKQSTTEHLVGPQRQFNLTESSLERAFAVMARLKYLAPRGANIAANAFTDQHGEVVEYNAVGGQKPEQMRPAPLPAYTQYYREGVLRNMDDISGQHEVSKAKTPAGVKAGIAIAFLQEKDDDRLAQRMRRFNRARTIIGEQLLTLAKVHYTSDRAVRIVGENGRHEILSLKGADLTTTQVVVMPGSALPQSRAARQALVIESMRIGLIQDRQAALRVLELGDIEQVFQDQRLDENAAYMENEMLARGDQRQVRPWDDDDVHMRIHEQEMKRTEFEEMGVSNPEAWRAFIAHWGRHKQQKEQKMAQLAAMMSGQAGGQGAPAGAPELPPPNVPTTRPGMPGPPGGRGGAGGIGTKNAVAPPMASPFVPGAPQGRREPAAPTQFLGG